MSPRPTRPGAIRLTRAAGLVDRIERTLTGEQWHGLAFGLLVRDVDATGAAAHPIPGAHSIWELVLHVSAWARIVDMRLRGMAHEPSSKEDWPPVADVSPAAWRRALDEMYPTVVASARPVNDRRPASRRAASHARVAGAAT